MALVVGESQPLVEGARSLAPMLSGLSEQIDRDRRLPSAVIDALREIGALRPLVPSELGGGGAHPLAFFDLIEELAAADPSTGWVTFITNGTKFIALQRMEPDGAARILAKGTDTIVAGVTAPRGRAERVPGGFQLSGRWSYASGCLHADWILAGSTVTVDGEVETLEGDRPHTRLFVLPVDEVRILDTWDPVGLRGTGSNDFEIDAAFVPTQMSLTMNDPVQRYFPAVGINRAAAAATSVGIGRAALDEFRRLSGRVRGGLTGGTPLDSQDVVRYRFAEATGLVDSGRALLRHTMASLHGEIERAVLPDSAAMANLDLAMHVGIFNAARAVESLAEVAGGPAIHTGNVLERLFRDAHAAANNAANSPVRLAAIGKSLLSRSEGAALTSR